MLQNYHHEERPWGWFDRFTQNESTSVKILHANSGARLSLQRHTKRDEWWQILSGSGTVRVGEDEHQASPGDRFQIPAGTLHRIQGGEEGISWLEICFGEFDENDIERLEDDFGRLSQ